MALPLSIQLQQQEEERKAQIDRETTLDAIRESIVQTVPLALGTVIGTVTKSPALGLIGSFVTDKIQEAYKQGRERRVALRKEKRQRDEAARILVDRGLAVDEEQALQRIEIAAAEKQQRIIKQNEDNALSEYNLLEKQKSEPTVAELDDEGGDPKRLVNEGGMALESTLAHVDSEISGLTDILLEKFADDEKIQDRKERKEERKEALERERIAEERRSNAKQEKLLEEQGKPQKQKEEEGGGILSFITEKLGTVLSVAGGISLAGGGGILGALGLGGAAAAGGATAGIGATLASIGTGIAGLGATLVSAPVLGIVGGTAAVAAGVYGLTQVDWDSVGESVSDFGDGLSKDFAKIGKDLSVVGDDIAQATSGLISGVTASLDSAYQDASAKLGEIADEVGDFVTDKAEKVGDFATESLQTAGDFVSDGASKLADSVMGFFSGGSEEPTDDLEAFAEADQASQPEMSESDLLKEQASRLREGSLTGADETASVVALSPAAEAKAREMEQRAESIEQGIPQRVIDTLIDLQRQGFDPTYNEDGTWQATRELENGTSETLRSDGTRELSGAFGKMVFKGNELVSKTAPTGVEGLSDTTYADGTRKVTYGAGGMSATQRFGASGEMLGESVKVSDYLSGREFQKDESGKFTMTDTFTGESYEGSSLEDVVGQAPQLTDRERAIRMFGEPKTELEKEIDAQSYDEKGMLKPEMLQPTPTQGKAMVSVSEEQSSMADIVGGSSPTNNNVIDAKTINNNQTTIQKTPLQPRSVETQNKFAMMN